MAAGPAPARRHSAHPLAVVLFLTVVTFGWSVDATAQEWRPWTIDFWRPFGVAVSVVHVQPTDGEVDPTTTVGFGAGFFPTAGWGPVFGLGWVDTHVRARGVTIGRLRARPIMGGLGYTWLRGPVSVKGSVAAGVVLNHASINEDLLAQLSGPTAFEVRNSAAVRLSTTLEYAVVRKLALRGNLSYLVTRPTVVVETAGGTTTRKWNASNVTAAGGVVFYPLR